MMKHFNYIFSLVFILAANLVYCQSLDILRSDIYKILENKNAVVGISIMGMNGEDTLTVNGNGHFPMQSVFKFPIALTILHKVDLGELKLDQEIEITKQELQIKLYSPIRDKYPDGVNLKLSQLINYMVSESDNIATEILLRLIGGPLVVEDFIKGYGIKDISIKYNEEEQNTVWKNQYENWISPAAATYLLETFYLNTDDQLSKNSYQFIWDAMRATKTGAKSIRGEIPKETVVAHKTGYSGTNDSGLTAALNDMGIVFLPNGKYFYLSIFVSNSSENEETNQKIISQIAKSVWNYFMSKYQ